MSEKITRREFLKLTGIGAAVTAVLSGCGPASRYVVRRPYTDLPEYNQTGTSTYFATTCRECAAGCGIIMRTQEGRAIKAEGNPNHPVNRGKICSKGLTSVQGLYNPDRVKGPQQAGQRGSGQFQAIDWDAAIAAVRDGLLEADRTAFLMGSGNDHLYDLVGEITLAANVPAPVRYSAETMFAASNTLLQAMQATFGQAAYPYFDLGGADLALSFGADFAQNWLSPVAYSRMYAKFRKGNFGRRGYLIAFEPHQSNSSSVADEWYPIIPGTEGLVALAIARLVMEARGAAGFDALNNVDPAAAAEAAGISLERLDHVARLFASARQPLALPGESALASAQGLANAQAILSLNAVANNLGAAGGVFLQPNEAQAQSMNDVAALVERMRSGQVTTLFIHGVNPAFELPAGLGFAQALQSVQRVISFSSFPDETAMLSDYVLPDHTALESWGYMRDPAGADRAVVSAVQPVVSPLYNTRATADVLLEAARQAGVSGTYSDEVDFLQQKLLPLMDQGGSIRAPEILTFWTQWLQNGGWWLNDTNLATPTADDLLAQPLNISAPAALGSDEFYLLPYAGLLGSGATANRPWMQETPDPQTTVMWNTVVQINPETAKKLGVTDDDVVKITSSAGEVEAIVYQYPAIRPDMVAIPFGQGHTALGRWAEGRGVNPAALLGVELNQAGDLAYYGGTRVKITPTGRRRPVSRLESKAGVYGHE